MLGPTIPMKWMVEAILVVVQAEKQRPEKTRNTKQKLTLR